MKLNKSIKITAFSSIMSALITTIILVGSFLDIFDLICASICSLIIHIINKKAGTRTAIMIYAVSSVLSFIILPFRTCSLYFTAFFGYFPILRNFLYNKLKPKVFVYFLLLLLYNLSMIALYIIFSNLFGLTNEPIYMYFALIVSSNIFYLSFDLLLGRIMIIFDYKISKIFKTRRNNK